MIKYKLIRIEENQPEITTEFTENEIAAIYDAMGDYQDYGDDEAELAESIRSKL